MGLTPQVSATVSLSFFQIGTKVDVTTTKKIKPINVSNTEAIDPICGMAVDTTIALHAERDGEISYFCSEHCRERFLAVPADTKAPDKPGGCCGKLPYPSWAVGTKAKSKPLFLHSDAQQN